MKILQVWNNEFLGQDFRECMLSVNSLCISNGLEYTIVCKNKGLFPEFENTVFIDYNDFIKDKDIEWWQYIIQNHQSQADFVRIESVKTTPDLFYIDADVTLLKIPEFVNNGLPYLGVIGNYLDFFMFYVNGNCQSFTNLFDAVMKRPPPKSWAVFMDYFALNYRVGGNNIKKVNIIPNDTYKRNWFKE